MFVDGGMASVKDGLRLSTQLEETEDVDDWPPPENSLIAALFTDGFYIGEVLGGVDDDTIKVSYMRLKIVKTADKEEHPRRFWYWPARKDKWDTHRNQPLYQKLASIGRIFDIWGDFEGL